MNNAEAITTPTPQSNGASRSVRLIVEKTLSDIE